MAKKLVRASLILFMLFLIQLPVRNAFGDPSAPQESILTKGTWVFDEERTLATATTEQQRKALQALKSLRWISLPTWLRFFKDGKVKSQQLGYTLQGQWWQDSNGQYHMKVRGKRSLLQVNDGELTKQTGRNGVATVYARSEDGAVAAERGHVPVAKVEREKKPVSLEAENEVKTRDVVPSGKAGMPSAKAPLDSSVDYEYRKLVRAFIDEHGFKAIDKYDVKGIKLGMSWKEAFNLLSKAGYVYKRIRVINKSHYRAQLKKEGADKTHEIELSCYREPGSGAMIIAKINFRQSFPTSYNLDLDKAREQIVLKYGNPNNRSVNRDKFWYRAGDVSLTIALMKGSGHQKINTILYSQKFQQALLKVSREHQHARKAEAEQKKPSAEPEF